MTVIHRHNTVLRPGMDGKPQVRARQAGRHHLQTAAVALRIHQSHGLLAKRGASQTRRLRNPSHLPTICK